MAKREYTCANPTCGKIVERFPSMVRNRVFCTCACFGEAKLNDIAPREIPAEIPMEKSPCLSPPPVFGPDQEYKPTVLSKVLARVEKRFIDKFWSLVDKDGPNGCWLWTGQIDMKGYGRPHWGGYDFRTHIFSYELHHGPFPKGEWLLRHTCDVRHCCNPDHLLIGTHLDNARDRDSRGRNGTLGERNHRTKLTVDIVRELRRRWTGERGQAGDLMREFGVRPHAFYAIIRRQTWKHID